MRQLALKFCRTLSRSEHKLRTFLRMPSSSAWCMSRVRRTRRKNSWNKADRMIIVINQPSCASRAPPAWQFNLVLSLSRCIFWLQIVLALTLVTNIIIAEIVPRPIENRAGINWWWISQRSSVTVLLSRDGIIWLHLTLEMSIYSLIKWVA